MPEPDRLTKKTFQSGNVYPKLGHVLRSRSVLAGSLHGGSVPRRSTGQGLWATQSDSGRDLASPQYHTP